MAKLKISFSWRDDLIMDDEDRDIWPMIRGYLRGKAANPEDSDTTNNITIQPYQQPISEDDDD